MKTLVLKVGTNILTTPSGRLDLNNMRRIVDQICVVRKLGWSVMLVSSGAITCGKSKLGFEPENITEKQVAAAVGQNILMAEYSRFFEPQGVTIAQVLLTKDALHNPKRAAYARATLLSLLKRGIVPIINENDTVAVEEIKFGDNDELSAEVARLTKSSRLIILTDIDGLYDANPKHNPKAKLIPVVNKINTTILSLAQGKGSKNSTGGMLSKLHAARTATAHGISVHIANGREADIVFRILSGESIGTCFARNKE